MTVSGISLLASKLQGPNYAHSIDESVGDLRDSTNTVVWPHEKIKLTDSLTSNVVPSANQIHSVSDIRGVLDNLIDQCRSQEESLLYFHTRFHHQQTITETFRQKLLLKMRNEYEIKLKSKFLNTWKATLRKKAPTSGILEQERKGPTPTILESVNLNDTLRNLALSLESPTGIDPNASVCSNISVPFQIIRNHRRRGN